MCESELERANTFRLRRAITAGPLARRSASAASSRRTATRCAPWPALDFDWLAEDDRLHILEAADRFARMAEELEAVRERAALLHEQITDLRAEQIDQRALYISIVAFIFLPLTFITGLLGMNVEGIPYAHTPLVRSGASVIFCVADRRSACFAWFYWRQLACSRVTRRLGLQLDVPVEIVAPALVQVIGREAAAMLLQLPAGRPERAAADVHVRLLRRAAALPEVARRAGGGDILPGRAAALGARQDMVEGQLAAGRRNIGRRSGRAGTG